MAWKNRPTNDWTDARRDRTRELWAAGASCSQIADDLNRGLAPEALQFTRNSIAGFLHRAGLTRGDQARKRPPKPRWTPPPPPPPVVAAPASAPADDRDEVPADPEAAVGPAAGAVAAVLALTAGGCRWPVGDVVDPDFHFCGQASGSGIPYCGDHARLAYQPPAARRLKRPGGFVSPLASNITGSL